MEKQEIINIFNNNNIEVVSIEPLCGGVNSKVSLVKSERMNYVFKLYPKSKIDNRNRFDNETLFINFHNNRLHPVLYHFLVYVQVLIFHWMIYFFK